MAKKPAVKEKPMERVVSFRAPDRVHGALKQIVGRLEMVPDRLNGSAPYERDVLNWLVGALFMEGPDKWPEKLNEARDKYRTFTAQN